MRNLTIACVAVVVSLVIGTPAEASPITISGSFVADNSDVGVGNLTGSFTGLFDTIQVTGVGTETFDNLTLTSISIGDPYGGAYDTANSAFRLTYLNGVLTTVELGVPEITSSEALGSNKFDFYVKFAGNPLAFVESHSGYNGTYSGTRTGTGSVTISNAAVPEPATLSLLGVGLAGFQLARRRRRASPR